MSISGRLLLFEAGSTRSDLHARYDSQDDLREFKLYAETVVIRSALRLPGAHVEIHARELRFEGLEASIDVTPPDNISGRPEPVGETQVVAHGTDGVAGLSSPPMEIFVERFHSDPHPEDPIAQIPRFILRGAGAQPAGEGRNGRNIVAPGTTFCGNLQGHPIIYSICTFADGTVSDECGSKKIFGERAIRAGTPGRGGAGGTFTFPALGSGLGPFVDLGGGAPGTPGQNRIGGLPSGTFAIVIMRTLNKLGAEPCGQVTSSLVSATRGAAATAPVAPSGDPGRLVESTDLGAWLHPLLVKSTLLFVKDAYLNERIPEARAILEEYRTLITVLKGDQPPGEEQDQFFQLAQEIESLLHRIDANLDYFGNPVTWVPMLSFEANLAAFTAEVERGINSLYLAHWVQFAAQHAANTRDAAIAARDRFTEEIADLVVEHAIAQEEMPVLLAEAEALEAKVAAAIAKLAALEAELEKRAQENVDDRHRLPLWKKAVGVLGAVTKVFPLGQPALGYAGVGLSLLSRFDPAHPLANLGELPDMLRTLKTNKYSDCVKGKASASNVNPKQEDVATLLFRLKGCAPLIQTGVKEIADVLTAVKADEEEVQAELEKLRASDPIFVATTKEIGALNAEKQQLGERIAATLDKLSKFSSAVEEDQLAIDRLERDLSAALDVLDHSSILFIADLGRREVDRLLNYQYLMAKSYQFRTLKPYTGNLQLGRLLERIRDLVAFQDSDHLLDPDQFQSLKAIYLEELGRIASEILADLNVNVPDHSSPVSYRLDPQELAALNQQGSVEIDLATKLLFGANEENLRIVNVLAQDLAVRQTGTIGNSATLRLKYAHSGFSRISRDGQTYLFTHYRTERVNPITWGTVYDGLSGKWTETQISAATDSLLRFLLDLSDSEDILLFSLPGAMAKLVLSKEVTAEAGVDLRIDGLILQIQYDYSDRNSALRQLNVEVPDGLRPRILLDQADANGRQDGRGSFTRSFNGPVTIQLEAPLSHGMWKFDHWETEGPQGGAADTARVIRVLVDRTRTARAIFRPEEEPPAEASFRRADANGDGSADITDAVNVLSFLFTGGAEPRCKDAADANDDGGVDITDAVFTLSFLFLGGETPSAPGPEACGPDRTPDDLGACSYDGCR